MSQLIKSKTQLLFTIIFSAATIFALSLSLPPVQDLTISLIQSFFNKILRKPERWLEIITHCSFIFIFSLWIIYFLNFSTTGEQIKNSIKHTLYTFLKSIYEYKILFISVLITLFLIFFKVITANFYYADDMWRNAAGSRSWIGFSRYISEFLSILIHTNIKLSDIAPFTQFITIIIMAFSIFLICYVINNNRYSVLAILAVSITFVSPFFSENFSYRFDAPYMALAVLFSAIPFLFIENRKAFIFISIISLILTCFSYQAGLSIYIILAIFLTLRKILKNDRLSDYGILVFDSLISFIIALVIFKLFFMNAMSNSDDDYFSTVIKLSSVPQNLINYFNIILTDFGNIILKSLTFIAFVSCIFVLVKNSLCNKWLAFIAVISGFVLSFVLSTGPYIIFERPLLTYRTFMGFNLLIALIVFILIEQKFLKFLTIAVFYCCVIFQFVYGNCLTEQKDYQHFRSALIAKDIGELAVSEQNIEIKFQNKVGLCDATKISRHNYPILDKIITQIPSENSIWNENYFTNFNLHFKNNVSLDKINMNLVKSSIYHNIYQNENKFIVELKN